ncbi:DUF2065 domain-containing protein [Nostocales cyanobacterium LEGE 12452]|nr:DUF2065 domain-containing protein [Nostocales cyanobacterium LEGE 12452]
MWKTITQLKQLDSEAFGLTVVNEGIPLFLSPLKWTRCLRQSTPTPFF